ncbi:alanine/glycine:cation symporter family protein [Anaeromicrobium sediminis]|uniref:Sodium:alanine symporter family protein n=1 Tax=Anaeromicrobium sediminis TaxID=1478221 RepID=A0A267MP33_9FIRM|nr:sodium:alanine symporter family protein [Anaeromicrobium sediminis]PAB61286.1 sodium:alanine symporter family protein [Anaeromicrobium sediminis]
MNIINTWNDWLNGIVWGPYMIILLIGTGIYMSFRLGFLQIYNFKYIIKHTIGRMFDKTLEGEGDISPGQAGLTAIAAVVGTGNIAGVATAISIGGPGAVFWMWLSAFFGMATKFSEITLGVHYREKREDGSYAGGAMYYLAKGLKQKWMAYFFSIMVIITYFIIGAIVDTNTIALSVQEQWGIYPLYTGIFLAIITGFVVLGGIKRIGEVCEFLTPFMGGIYIFAGLSILILNVEQVPGAIATIFTSAFRPAAATGGFAGATVARMMTIGTARGLFSNEAGMGSSPMIHGSAKTDHSARQGMWGIAEVFVDSLVICTITALAIIISGEWTTGVSGAALTIRAFSNVLPGNIGGYVVVFSAMLFGYSCLISANYYCESAGQYIFGIKSILPIRILWIVFILIGSVGGLEFVWALADTANGLMAIPNLIAILALSGVVVAQKKDFFSNCNDNKDIS